MPNAIWNKGQGCWPPAASSPPAEGGPDAWHLAAETIASIHNEDPSKLAGKDAVYGVMCTVYVWKAGILCSKAVKWNYSLNLPKRFCGNHRKSFSHRAHNLAGRIAGLPGIYVVPL